MHLLTDLSTWLKLIGALSTGIGSFLLAWRIKAILKWVVYCLVAHENSINELFKLVSNQQQTKVIISGTTKHLLDIESKLGVVLLIVGFLLLGIGMLCNVASFIIGAT
jgi:hypothetical protein